MTITSTGKNIKTLLGLAFYYYIYILLLILSYYNKINCKSMLLVGRYFMVHDDSRLGYDKSHLLTHDMSVPRLYNTSAELVCFSKRTHRSIV